MKYEEILVALEEISDKHIEEAGKSPKRKKSVFWMSAVAALLVVVIGINVFSGPARISAYAVALPEAVRSVEFPEFDDYSDRDEWLEARDLWDNEVKLRAQIVRQAASDLCPFFTEGTEQFLLTENGENKLWSPINAYIGLAMMTELTEGDTRQQILNLLAASDTEELRQQVSTVWENTYQNNKNEICVLANSLWLEKGFKYNQDAMAALGYHYYASVYQGDLGSDRINKDIATWINNNTGNFLSDSTGNISLSQDIVLALYSTLYFQAKWSDEFNSSKNTDGEFYMQDGTTQVTYMNKEREDMNYYWGENFSAVSMWLKNGCRMWFVLPDEGMTTNDVLESGTYMEMVLSSDWQDSKYMKVNLSVPKFDVSSVLELKDGLMEMGVTDIFDDRANFDGITADVPIFLTGASQAVRVQIDEEGVKAATYIEFPGAGSAEPAKEIIDFVLDRPFLFVITKNNLPLFAGCVNNPEQL